MLMEQVTDSNSLQRVHRFVADPEPADGMRSKMVYRKPVGVESAGPKALKPVRLDDMDTTRRSLTEEHLSVLCRRR